MAAGLLGLILSGTAWFAAARYWDQPTTQALLDDQGHHQRLLIQSALRDLEDTITAMSSFFRAPGSVFRPSEDVISREKFDNFAREAASVLINFDQIAWVVPVRRDARDEHEFAARLEGLSSYRITAKGPDGKPTPAPDRDFYFPVAYLAGLSSGPYWLGLDVSSYKSAFETMERSRFGDWISASPVLETQIASVRRQVVLLFASVYKRSAFATDPRGELAGFVAGVFSPGLVVESALRDLQRNGSLDARYGATDAYFFDGIPGAADLPFYVYSRLPGAKPRPRAELEAGFHWSGDVAVGDRVWTMFVVPVANAPFVTANNRARIILNAGFIITAMLVTYLVIAAGHLEQISRAKRELEARVVERTAELNERNIRLTAEMAERERAQLSLKESEANLREAERIAHVGHWVWDIPTGDLGWSDEIYRIFGLPPRDFVPTYQAFLGRVHPEDRDLIAATVDRAVKEREPYAVEHRIVLPDGSIRHVEERGESQYDDAGNPVRMLGTVLDITEREQIEAALYEREEQFHTLANSIPQHAWMAKADGDLFWFNDRWYEYTGTFPQQMEGWGWQSVCDAKALPEILARWKESLASGELFDMTVSLKGADGVFRPFLIRAMPLRDAQGRIARWFGTNTDITAQKEHEAHLNFVLRELSHRSKNLLAVVQSMARQTMQHSVGPEDFENRFTGRLHGLARSHDLLVRGDWVGASIRDLVHTQLAPFVPEEGVSLVVEGPDLTLKPESVQNLGFALFELATNAAKYGALSAPEGKVAVRWEFIDGGERLRFVWQEIGGPPVTPPHRKGFGIMVIERLMAKAFGGAAISEFRPEGFRWTLEIPRSHLLGRSRNSRAQ